MGTFTHSHVYPYVCSDTHTATNPHTCAHTYTLIHKYIPIGVHTHAVIDSWDNLHTDCIDISTKTALGVTATHTRTRTRETRIVLSCLATAQESPQGGSGGSRYLKLQVGSGCQERTGLSTGVQVLCHPTGRAGDSKGPVSGHQRFTNLPSFLRPAQLWKIPGSFRASSAAVELQSCNGLNRQDTRATAVRIWAEGAAEGAAEAGRLPERGSRLQNTPPPRPPAARNRVGRNQSSSRGNFTSTQVLLAQERGGVGGERAEPPLLRLTGSPVSPGVCSISSSSSPESSLLPPLPLHPHVGK